MNSTVVKIQAGAPPGKYRELHIDSGVSLLFAARRATDHRRRLLWSISQRCIIAVPITPMTNKGPA